MCLFSFIYKLQLIHFTGQIQSHVCLTCMVAPSNQGHYVTWKNSMPCNEVHLKWLSLQLQISVIFIKHATFNDVPWNKWHLFFLKSYHQLQDFLIGFSLLQTPLPSAPDHQVPTKSPSTDHLTNHIAHSWIISLDFGMPNYQETNCDPVWQKCIAILKMNCVWTVTIWCFSCSWQVKWN